MKLMTRREVRSTSSGALPLVLAGWCAALLLLSCGSDERAPSTDPPRRFVGTAPSSDRDFETVLPYFSQITPENAGKWGVVEAVRDEMDWSGLDQAYDFARANDVAFKFHALVWGQQQPSWVAALSQEEQLAELEEWMSLVAKRYPDLALIDVVNEPLHAQPSYREALGGDGESGWDWAVRAFELARNYFPQSELILNDYDILKHESFTENYLAPIRALQERDLIDAIGLQAHNLEKSDPSVVADNLDTLAQTDLPLYISEFDLDIEDDALHAHVFRDLFTTFWESSGVSGVTVWGHLQGDTWRPNTYLLRADYSARPAMDWLECYLAEKSSCPLPKYVPVPRKGSKNGLTLEAESFDETGGVVTLGAQIGYTDQGDWISYLAVEFQEDWDQITIVYANGQDVAGSVSFHLGDLDEDPLLTASVPSTGGWGSYQALTLDWPGFDGKEDLYIRFNDVDGVGNFDKFRLGHPPAEPDGSNLIVGGDFEVDTTGWSAWGGTVQVSLDHVHQGEQSLILEGRSDYGSAVYDLSNSVTPGETYSLSLVVDISGKNAEEVRVSKMETCAGEDTSIERLFDALGVTPGEWQSMQGAFSVADCDLQEFKLFISGPPAGIDIYVDDVSVQ